MIEVRPQPGPQEAFLSTRADIAIYGGAAGGGKSWALCAEAMRHTGVSGYRAIVFRRHTGELIGGGSIWEEAQSMYRSAGAVFRSSPYLDCVFPSGARVEYSHLQHEKDKHSHQSKQYALIAFDELVQFTEHQFWYMLSRNRSTCGIRPYIRAATNPDPNSWVKDLIAWWLDEDGYPIKERSGRILHFARDGNEILFAARLNLLARGYSPISLTFIPAMLSDNKIMNEKDPQYRSRLEAMPLVERERLLCGNWKIKPSGGLYFKRQYFEIIDTEPEYARAVRGWDKAGTEPHEGNRDPDWTRGVKICKMRDGNFCVLNCIGARQEPSAIFRMIKNTALHDGPDCMQAFWQDPGQAGKVDKETTRNLLVGSPTSFWSATTNKIVSATPFSVAAERGKVYLLRGGWNSEFIAELENFGGGRGHDDIVDACSVAFRELTRTHVIDRPITATQNQIDYKWSV